MLHSAFAQYKAIVENLNRAADDWLLGLLLRGVFLAVLFVYFFNSALTKFDGFPYAISDAAYFQILPSVVEAAGFDASAVGFLPWGLIVYAGSFAEILLPILIVIGALTRLAALGMIGFVFVQSYVDIAFHGVGPDTVGQWFDRLSDSAILDQRAFWIAVLSALVLKGAGAVSVDALLVKQEKEKL